jgi:hypothetical protein
MKLHGLFHEISWNFHGTEVDEISWNSMENFVEFHEIP